MEDRMSRKRTPGQDTPENTNTSSTEPPVATEPPAPEAGQEPQQQSFADRVGQREWKAPPDPFGIARDNLVGLRLMESRQDRQVAIKFGEGRPEDKPSQPVIDKLKEAGFRWNPTHRVWTHPVRGDSAMSTRVDAERLYQEIRQIIRQEKGIDEVQPDVPF
jgi:hypothetical protein